MLRKSMLAIIGIIIMLTGCASFGSSDKPLGISGSFKVTMVTNAKYFPEVKQYPVSGFLTTDVPFLNQAVIPAGTPIFGIYKNSGFSCQINWITISIANGQPLSNANGIATTKCFARMEIKESDIVKAKWN